MVWRYHLYGVESWDFLPGGDVVIQATSDSKDHPRDYEATEVATGDRLARAGGAGARPRRRARAATRARR